MIFTGIPYRTDKNLGKAYNEFMSLLPEDGWAIITDWDVLFLLPETIANITEYTNLFPDTGLFTCFGSRSHINSTLQLLPQGSSDNQSILFHTHQAKEQQKELYKVTEIPKHISGFLMVLSKKVWNDIKFVEDMKCLGVDNLYSNRILNSALKIRRMDGVYVWHTYRLWKDIKDTSHLI